MPWEIAGLPKETPVLVGFSGGADSVALLHLLKAFSLRDGFAILAVHVHHGIRGTEADRDAEFCEDFAKKIGVEIITYRIDVPTIADGRGESLEEVARNERYRIFDTVMQERNIPLLAVAHHAGDNAETVLFRLARGTGLAGLCGIKQLRKIGQGYVTRPLLPFSKDEILAYCRDRNLSFVTDSTNLEPCCTRNLLRLEILPTLEKSVPNAVKNIANATARLQLDEDYLTGVANGWTEEHRRGEILSLDGMKDLHPAIRSRVLANFTENAEAVHLTALTDLILSGRGGCIPLPHDRTAVVLGGRLRILPLLRGEGLRERKPLCEETFSLCDGKLTVSSKQTENSNEPKKIHKLSTKHYIIADEKSAIIMRYCWKPSESGDRIRVGRTMQKCSELLHGRCIPTAFRSKLPVLCDGDGNIVWLPFYKEEKQPTGKVWEIEITID